MSTTTENGSLVVSFDGDDQDDRNSLTKGTIIKFVDGVWSVKNDPSFKPEGPFLAYRADLGLQCWEGGMVVDCRRRTPGVRLPELCDQLNSLIPQEQWEMDLNGDPRKPWELAWFVYLARLSDGGLFCHINSTTGCRIGVNELKERVQVMQALRGQNIAPIVKLTSLSFKAKMGSKQRPQFEIIDWHPFGPPPTTPVVGPKTPQIGGPLESTKVGKPVKTLAEELNDAVPF